MTLKTILSRAGKMKAELTLVFLVVFLGFTA